jgi:hypothetical protein
VTSKLPLEAYDYTAGCSSPGLRASIRLPRGPSDFASSH